MADENRDQMSDDNANEENKQTQPAESGTAAEEDDVQAYGEPSDGSGGTKGGA